MAGGSTCPLPSKTMNTNISDKQALEAFNSTGTVRAHIATHPVERTVVYPVEIEYQPGVKTMEIRTFVRMGEYCSKVQWERALELEKQYPDLQKAYRKVLKDRGLPTSIKISPNPLKAVPIDPRR